MVMIAPVLSDDEQDSPPDVESFIPNPNEPIETANISKQLAELDESVPDNTEDIEVDEFGSEIVSPEYEMKDISGFTPSESVGFEYSPLEEDESLVFDDELSSQMSKTSKYIATQNLINAPESKLIEEYNALSPELVKQMLADSKGLDSTVAALASKARVPIRFAQDNPSIAWNRATANHLERRKLTKAVDAQLRKDPDSATIIEPNFDNVDILTKSLINDQYINGSKSQSFLDKLSTGWGRGDAVVDMSEYKDAIKTALSNGNPIPKDALTKLDNLSLRGQAGIQDGSFPSTFLVETASILPPLFQSLEKAAEAAIYGAGAGSVIGAGAGSVLPGIGTVAGILTGISGGAGWGATAGFSKSTYDQTYVGAAYQYSKLKVNKKALDPKEVDNAATMEAIISTGLDVAGVAVVGGLYKGAAKSIHTVIAKSLGTPEGVIALSNALKAVKASAPIKRSVISGLKEVAKGAGLTAGAIVSEGATEGVQEIVLDYFGEQAKKYTADNRSEYYNTQDALNPETVAKAWESSKRAMMGSVALAIVPSSVTTFINIVNHKAIVDSEATGQAMINVAIASNDSMQSSSDPGNVSIFNQTLTEGGIGTSYFDPSDMQGVIDELSTEGFDANNTEWIGVVQEAITFAVDNGKRVELPTADVIGIMANKEGGRLREFLATSEEAASPYRSEEINNFIEEKLRDEVNLAETKYLRDKDIDTLTESIDKQLSSTGVLSKNVSQVLSILIPTWADTKTRGTDKLPSQLINELGLRIQSDLQLEAVQGTYNLQNRLISLGNATDLSTFLHESGHFFLDAEQVTDGIDNISSIFPEMAIALNVPEQEITQTFLDPESNPQQYEDMHEYFAREFEAYLKKGKAPTTRLADSFRNFREWMELVYKGTTREDVGVSEGMQAMFDRLLVGDVEPISLDIPRIERSAVDDATKIYDDAIANPKSTDEERALALANKNEADRKYLMQELYMILKKGRELADNEKPEYAKEALEIATRLVDSDNKVNIIEFIKYMDGVKLDRADVKAALGVTVLPKKLHNMTTLVGGESITDIVKGLGYSEQFPDMTLSSFLEFTLSLPSRKDRIDQEFNKLMADYSVHNSDEALYRIADEVQAAIIDADDMAILLNEARAAAGLARIDKEAVRQMAIDSLYQYRANQLSNNKFSDRRDAAKRDYEQAKNNGDTSRAADKALDYLLNTYLHAESSKLAYEYNEIKNSLARFTKKAKKKEIIKVGGDFWDRLSMMLASAGIIPVNEVSGNIKAYNQWVNSDAPDRPASMFSLDDVTPLDEMRFGQVVALNDAVNSMYAASENHNKVMLGNEEANLLDVVNQIGKELAENGKNIDLTYRGEEKDARKKSSRFVMSNLRILPWAFKLLSNPKGVAQSVMQLSLDRPFVLAIKNQNIMLKKHFQPIIDKIQSKDAYVFNRMKKNHVITSLIDNEFFDKGVLSGNQIIAFALNLGTQNNIQTLLEGYGIIEANEIASPHNPVVQEVISHLNKDDWLVIQEIWKQIDALFEPLYRIEEKYRGKQIIKESGIKIPTVNNGVIQGYYYPLIKDNHYTTSTLDNVAPDRINKKTAEELFNGGQRKSKLSDQVGAAKERTDAIYSVSLDVMTVGMAHLNSIIYMLSHYEAVDSANNIISDKKFREDYQRAAGRHELSALDDWLNDIANPRPIDKKDFISSSLRHLRVGAVLTLLGASIFKTAPKQLLGVFTAIDQVGIKAENETQKMAGIRGVGRLLSVFASLGDKSYRDKNIKFMLEHSAIMDDRINLGSFDKDVSEAKAQLKGKKGLSDKWNAVIMTPIVFVQSRMVDTPIWLASYENSINSRKGISITDADIKSAAAYADSIVELSQGAARNKNLPWLVRSQRPELLRSVLIFMTAMLAIFNGVAADVQSVARGNKTPAEGFLGVVYKLMLPAVSITAINYLASLAFSSDEEEESNLANEYIHEQRVTILGILPFGNMVSSAYDGFPATLTALDIVGKGITSTGTAVDKIGTDKELTDREIKNIAVSLGTLLHVGGSNQVVKSAQGIAQSLKEYDGEVTKEMLYKAAYGATRK